MNCFKPVFLTIGTMFAAAVVVLFSGCATATNTLADQQAALPKDKVDARALFKENCMRCHGMDGQAKTFHGVFLNAQNFTSSDWQIQTTDEQITRAIRTGPGLMPAFGQKLSAAEVDALAAYVRSLRTP